MAQKRIKTKVQGVRYREHPTRKHGLGPDRYFMIRYRIDGAEKEEGLGWASQGWTVTKAADTLAELKRNQRIGEGEKTLQEKREKAEAIRLAEEAEKERIEAERLAVEQAEAERIRLERETVFQTVFERYLEANSHKKTTNTEQIYFANWIEPEIGKKQLLEVLPLDLERIKRNMGKKGRRPRSIQYCMAIIRQVFRFAEKQNLFEGRIPTRSVSLPRFDNGRIRFLTIEEAERLLAELKRRSQQTWAMATVSLHCGLRFSELANLRWQCVDTGQMAITLLDTKNGRTRIVPMTEAVCEIFCGMKRGANNALVFPDQYGRVMKRISPAFFRAVDALNLNEGIQDDRMKLVFHSLRHTFGSRLIEAGADMAVVRDLLGHRDFTMLSRYAHSGDNSRKQAVAAMERMLAVQQPKKEDVIVLG